MKIKMLFFISLVIFIISIILYFGTALGVIREQRFIPYDTDIDIAIFKKDIKNFNKLGNIITTNKKFKLKSKLPMNSKNIMEYNFIHKKTDVSIDIFLIIEKNNKYKFLLIMVFVTINHIKD